MKQYLFKSILTLAAAAAFIGCSEEIYPGDEKKPGGDDSDKICFTVSENSASRGGSTESRRVGGAYIYNGKDSLYLSLTVSEQDMPDTRGATIAADSPLCMTCLKRSEGNRYSYYFSNVMFSKGASGVWESDPVYWWPGGNYNFKFYGYAPADAKGATYIADEDKWQPKLDFTVPANATDQPDLVYHDNYKADGTEFEYVGSYNETVPLTMKHALACVGFRTGTGMAYGKITKVTLTNVVTHGTLNLTNGEWTLDESSTGDVSASMDKQTSDNIIDINTDADNTYFMLLPGCNSNATTVTIDFKGSNGVSSTYTGTFPAETKWEAGNRYTYTITIDPDLNITIDSEVQDAHYVIAKATVSAANLQPGKQWELTATASDGADVTLLATLNQYQQQGFWTDRIQDENGKDLDGARGDKTLIGEGATEVYVFIPENVTEADRDITLKLKVKGESKTLAETTIRQLHPDWTGSDFGWEQLENDPLVQWGFKWTRNVTYTKENIAWNRFIYGPMIIALVEQHNAGRYAYVDPNTTGTGQRTSININYTKLNDLSSLELSNTNGENNTRLLHTYSGGATNGELEKAIKDLAPGHYFLWIGYGGIFNEQIISPGELDDLKSAFLGYILKKNKYNISRITKEDGGVTVISETPIIKEEDIVWYLPAIDQFNSGPIQNPLNGIYWSSNPDGTNNAFTSSGSDARTNSHKIRACRQRP